MQSAVGWVGKKNGYRNAKKRLPATEKVKVGGGKLYAPKSPYRVEGGNGKIRSAPVTDSVVNGSQ